MLKRYYLIIKRGNVFSIKLTLFNLNLILNRNRYKDLKARIKRKFNLLVKTMLKLTSFILETAIKKIIQIIIKLYTASIE